MAINKTAKNLSIELKRDYRCMSKTFYEESEKVEIIATKEKLTLYSVKKTQIRGNKS